MKKLSSRKQQLFDEILFKASEAGSVEIIKLALENGANPNYTDKLGLTPLHEAVINNNEDAVILLLEMGSDPRILAHRSQKSPADYAKTKKMRNLFISKTP